MTFTLSLHTIDPIHPSESITMVDSNENSIEPLRAGES
jgi:hypothetical protein